MSSLRTRRGFTLIELLVVITIIAILIALLLPAVQSSREAGRRTQCVNNMKQLCIAVQNFESTHNVLPPYFGIFPPEYKQPTATDRRWNNNAVFGSWFVHLLPHMEQQALYDKIQKDIELNQSNWTSGSVLTTTPATGIYIPGEPGMFVPSGPPVTTNHVGHTGSTSTPGSYVGRTSGRWEPANGGPKSTTTKKNGGVINFSSATFKALICPSAPNPSDYISRETVSSRKWGVTNYLPNWLFFTATKVKGNPGSRGGYGGVSTAPYSKPVTVSAITDGMSNSMMFGEGYSSCDSRPRIALFNNGQYDNFGLNHNKQPNTYFFQQKPPQDLCNNWRAQSPHLAGMTAGMGDGSVHTINPSISKREIVDGNIAGIGFGVDAVMGKQDGVWDRLMLPRDGQPLGHQF
jgi:prepilin-type N-terminal cleavage/methylation domain-containing protein